MVRPIWYWQSLVTVSDRPTTLYFNISICQYFKLLCQLFQYIHKDPLKWVFCLPNMLPLLPLFSHSPLDHPTSPPALLLWWRGGPDGLKMMGDEVRPTPVGFPWSLAPLPPASCDPDPFFPPACRKTSFAANRCLQLNCSAGSVIVIWRWFSLYLLHSHLYPSKDRMSPLSYWPPDLTSVYLFTY